MTKKSRRLLIFSVLIFGSVVILALGLKYFPYTKVIKMPAGSEQPFVDPQKIQTLLPNTLYYDFEVPPGKEMPDGYYKGVAHSGQYSVKAFGQNSFSIAIERTAREVGVENLKAVALSAWIYVFPTKNEVKGNMVFTASNELGVNVTWQGIGIVEPEVPRGKWFKVSKYFDLTSIAFKPDYKIQVYFWNNSSSDILIDDYTVIFGEPVDRRGDSALVDLTRPGGFVPRFNYPPFPVSLIEKEQTSDLPKLADISPEDKIIAGKFLNAENDGLFVAGPDGRPAAFAFCSAKGVFRKITLTNSAVIAQVQPIKKLLKGNFSGGRNEEIILCGEKGWMLCSIESVTNPCKTEEALKSSLKVLFTSSTPALSFYSGDFNADHRSELLAIADDGSWKLMTWEGKGNGTANWRVIAGENSEKVPVWNKADRETGISAGRFRADLPNDLILTVVKNRDQNLFTYCLLKFNSSKPGWDPLYSEKQGFMGKTIGLDTLKPSDQFLITAKGDAGVLKVFRYNRDWRFDLKEIQFNDSAFRIISGVDFTGFANSSNPKYYEEVAMVPGNFGEVSSTSFLVAGSVKKARKYETILPDFVHLYRIQPKK